MALYNKMEQLLYFSICFLSEVLIINYLSIVYLNTPSSRQNGSTPIILELSNIIVSIKNESFRFLNRTFQLVALHDLSL